MHITPVEDVNETPFAETSYISQGAPKIPNGKAREMSLATKHATHNVANFFP